MPAKQERRLRLQPALARLVASKRFLARAVLVAERCCRCCCRSLRRALCFSASWFGLFRIVPDCAAAGAARRLRPRASSPPSSLPRVCAGRRAADADRLLEERNGLPHQPVAVQEDEPAFETPFARALWHEHQTRMAERIAVARCRPAAPRYRPPRPLCACAPSRRCCLPSPSAIPCRTAPARCAMPSTTPLATTDATRSAHRRLGDAACLYRPRTDLSDRQRQRPPARRDLRAAILRTDGPRHRRCRQRDGAVPGHRQHERHRGCPAGGCSRPAKAGIADGPDTACRGRCHRQRRSADPSR